MERQSYVPSSLTEFLSKGLKLFEKVQKHKTQDNEIAKVSYWKALCIKPGIYKCSTASVKYTITTVGNGRKSEYGYVIGVDFFNNVLRITKCDNVDNAPLASLVVVSPFGLIWTDQNGKVHTLLPACFENLLLIPLVQKTVDVLNAAFYDRERTLERIAIFLNTAVYHKLQSCTLKTLKKDENWTLSQLKQHKFFVTKEDNLVSASIVGDDVLLNAQLYTDALFWFFIFAVQGGVKVL